MKKQMQKEKIKKQKEGITLIALVVTIIVMLILAGISISMITGDNSILQKASDTKERTTIGREKEDIALVWTSLLGKKLISGNEITDLMFEEELNNNGDDTIVGYDDEKNYLVYFNETERTYKVDKGGNIMQLENAPELITEKIYVTLYSDGTLAFSSNNKTDNKKTVTNTYTIGKNDVFETQDMVPWNSETSSIKKVLFVNKISPTSTKMWFRNCINMTSIEKIQNLNTSRVKNMEYMFCQCEKLSYIDVSYFYTSRVKSMRGMFSNCKLLSNLNLSSFDTSKVTDMCYMFANSTNLSSIDLSSFNTSNVTDMSQMFKVTNLSNLDLSNFDTSNVTTMYSMFSYCQNLKSLDLSSFNTSKVEDMVIMFDSCTNLKTIYVDKKLWNISNVTNTKDPKMFRNCYKIVGGKGTTYNSGKVDKTYARIDGGPTSSTPGYFTYKSSN